MSFECVKRGCNYWKVEVEGHCTHPFPLSERCFEGVIREREGECPAPYYIYMINSAVCLCGRGKIIGKPFCFQCMDDLPRDIRAHLGCRIGDGFEGAYDAAQAFLEEWRCSREEG